MFNLQILDQLIKLKFKIPVIQANSGEKAIKIVHEKIHKHLEKSPKNDKDNKFKPFKVIMIDCNMPIIDGFEATK